MDDEFDKFLDGIGLRKRIECCRAGPHVSEHAAGCGLFAVAVPTAFGGITDASGYDYYVSQFVWTGVGDRAFARILSSTFPNQATEQRVSVKRSTRIRGTFTISACASDKHKASYAQIPRRTRANASENVGARFRYHAAVVPDGGVRSQCNPAFPLPVPVGERDA